MSALPKRSRSLKQTYAPQQASSDEQPVVGAKAILSEGIPDWHWHTVLARWNTPVADNKLVRIGLMPPWLTAIVGVLSALGIWLTWAMAAKMLWGMGPVALPKRAPRPIKEKSASQEYLA